MSFRDFTFPQVIDQLGLTLSRANLFPDPPRFAPDPAIRSLMERGLIASQGINNEKARSEFVVAPMLLHLWSKTGEKFGIFSGTEFNVDGQRGLNGFCDFLLSRDPNIFQVRAPVMTIVEAKNDNVANGFGQCIATMYAAARFNEREGKPADLIHGCSTTGRDWKFCRLAGTVLTIDDVDYVVPLQIEEIAGILLSTVHSAGVAQT